MAVNKREEYEGPRIPREDEWEAVCELSRSIFFEDEASYREGVRSWPMFFHPVVMALVGQYFQQGQSIAVGFVAMGGGIGAFMLPFIMAFISDHFGLQRGFFFYVSVNVLMVAFTIIVKFLIRRRA